MSYGIAASTAPTHKVLVIGGEGFIGRHVIQSFLADGAIEVLSISRHAPSSSSTSLLGPLYNHLTLDIVTASSHEVFNLSARLQDWGCTAVVNLAGIKCEQRGAASGQSFERVHVDATHRIVLLCKSSGVSRLVHISVVRSRPDGENLYYDTKFRSEELVRESGLEWTILKPAVVWGRGDDMVTNLVKSVRLAPVFPLIGDGSSVHQPIYVGDIAHVVLLCVRKPEVASHKIYELVGPRRISLREMALVVAKATGLPLSCMPTPVWAHQFAARAMTTVLERRSLITPAQLEMLQEGLTGNSSLVINDLFSSVNATPSSQSQIVPQAAPHMSAATAGSVTGAAMVAGELGSTTADASVKGGDGSGSPVSLTGSTGGSSIATSPFREFTVEAVKELEGDIGSLFGISTRLWSTREQYNWIESFLPFWDISSKVIAPVAVILLTLLVLSFNNIWYTMALFHGLVTVLAAVWLSSKNFPWRKLLFNSPNATRAGHQQFSPLQQQALTGVAAAIALYFACWLGFGMLKWLFPQLIAQKDALYGWKRQMPGVPSALLTIFFIAPAEELLFRGALLLPFVAHYVIARDRDAKDKDRDLWDITTPQRGGSERAIMGGGFSVNSALENRGGGWLGCFLATLVYAGAHFAIGSPLLVIAALVMGMIWSALVVKTQSLVPAIVCHSVWDLLVMFLFPY